ncbi:hypothetical protein C8R47DRAFT_375312 [Mycena vitilis]|nr:hypothetical protein C8R47DRAFT_375312 [Mycena vitilis]
MSRFRNSRSTTHILPDTYVAFEGEDLVRALFINSKAFLQGDMNRSSVNLDLTFTGKGADTTLSIKRLAIGHADDTYGLTWGGQTYESQSGKVEGELSLNASQSATAYIVETEVVLFCRNMKIQHKLCPM